MPFPNVGDERSHGQLAVVPARATILLDSERCAALVRGLLPTQALDPPREFQHENS